MTDDDERGGGVEAEPERPDRVKGDRHEGPIPAKDLLRIVVIGVPVMIAAWYFLLWMKGGLH